MNAIEKGRNDLAAQLVDLERMLHLAEKYDAELAERRERFEEIKAGGPARGSISYVACRTSRDSRTYIEDVKACHRIVDNFLDGGDVDLSALTDNVFIDLEMIAWKALESASNRIQFNDYVCDMVSSGIVREIKNDRGMVVDVVLATPAPEATAAEKARIDAGRADWIEAAGFD